MKCRDCQFCVKEQEWRVCDFTGAQVLPAVGNRDDPPGFPCPCHLPLARSWGRRAAESVVKSACERNKFDALLEAYKTAEERRALQDLRLLLARGKHTPAARLRELVAQL